MLILDWLYYIALAIVLIVGLLLNILGLPGLWLMVGAVGLYAWLTWPHYVSIWTVVVILVLALLAELVEFLAGAAGSAQAGGTKRSAAGAIVGGILGGLFLSVIPVPIISTIIGACLGAFLGAWLVELAIRRDVEHSTRVGWGAAKGRFFGIASKSAFGLVMLAVAMFSAFPTGRSGPAPGLPPVEETAKIEDPVPADVGEPEPAPEAPVLEEPTEDVRNDVVAPVEPVPAPVVPIPQPAE